jgi:hypothetical protein
MKKIILLFFICFSGFAQLNYVQISTNSTSVYVTTNLNDPINPYNDSTSDAGLNTIFQNHNVTTITDNFHEIDNTNAIFAIYSGTNLNGFITDLENYSSLVTKVSISPEFETFGDVLMYNLVNPYIGVQTGTDSNGIVITNDSSLNSILFNHNVTYFQNYYLQCDCNVINLKNDLINYNSVISSSHYAPLVFLNTPEFSSNLIKIYPIPFQNEIEIDSNNLITNYKLFSLDGKIITDVNQFENFKNSLLNLNSGIYIIELTNDSSEVHRQKIIKK